MRKQAQRRAAAETAARKKNRTIATLDIYFFTTSEMLDLLLL